MLGSCATEAVALAESTSYRVSCVLGGSEHVEDVPMGGHVEAMARLPKGRQYSAALVTAAYLHSQHAPSASLQL